MAPTFQNVTTDVQFVINPSFTCHNITGDNRLLIVTIAINGASPGTPSDVTYNSVSMGSAVFNQLTPINGFLRYLVYVKVAPATGSNTITITGPGSTPHWVRAATSYTGVNQLTPTDTWVSATGQTSPATVDVSSAVGDTVFAGVGQNDAAINAIGGAAVERSAANSGIDVFEKTSDDTGAATRTMSWAVTTGVNPEWVIAGVSLNPKPEITVAWLKA
jgi:hypothetical protein